MHPQTAWSLAAQQRVQTMNDAHLRQVRRPPHRAQTRRAHRAR
ncbi:hypothetical protein Q6348_08325 [Isoptericola sp. b441]|uniref:Uncharacterized protein n=1 Tax=Actinotalea lenta TaxID=3064654 RepID=A0ABT9D9E7_9CELL|nr:MULTISPECIES: hypothetical protein [unclassified Isoptericola]MDO8107200.1 hypothetical protein [Isoptericola sp. b441]MDO8121122.1 hypothetical protein [Isoptericola sp. b490]